MIAKRNMALYHDRKVFERPEELYAYKKGKGTLDIDDDIDVDEDEEAAQYLQLVQREAPVRSHERVAAPPPSPAPAPAPAPVRAPVQARPAPTAFVPASTRAPAQAPARAPASAASRSRDYEDLGDFAGERSYFVEGYEDDLPDYSRASSRRSSRSRSSSQPSDPNRPIYHPDAAVQYWQGRQIGCSIGGMAAYCRPRENESHAEALTRGGLTQNRALEVVKMLKDEGIMTTYFGRDPNSPEARRAQQILAEVGEFVCRR